MALISRADAFRHMVRMTDDGCWVWEGSFSDDGRGHRTARFFAGKKYVRPARWAYEKAKGTIPPGLILRRTCNTEDCVNPDHQEPGPRDGNSGAIIKGPAWLIELERTFHEKKAS